MYGIREIARRFVVVQGVVLLRLGEEVLYQYALCADGVLAQTLN